MREILFRGKRISNGKWVEGGYCQKHETTYCFATDAPNPLHHYIACDEMTDWNLPNEIMLYEVDTSTICQYIGLTDINDRKVFDGDIIRGPEGLFLVNYHYDRACYFAREIGTYVQICMSQYEMHNDFEIVGNKFDNPDLLEEGMGE